MMIFAMQPYKLKEAIERDIKAGFKPLSYFRSNGNYLELQRWTHLMKSGGGKQLRKSISFGFMWMPLILVQH